MKAKELAEKYKMRPQDNPDEDRMGNGLMDATVDMVREIGGLMKARNAKSNEALISVIKEQEQKFEALVRICFGGSDRFDTSKYPHPFRDSVFRFIVEDMLRKDPVGHLYMMDKLGWEFQGGSDGQKSEEA